MLRYFLRLDQLGEGVSLQVDGKRHYKTAVGAMLTLLIYIFVIPYAVIKYMQMMEYGDTTHQLQEEDLAGFEVPGSDLNLDWSFHLYSGRPVRGIDKEISLMDYFDMKAMLQKVIKSQSKGVYSEWEPIKMVPCNTDQLSDPKL